MFGKLQTVIWTNAGVLEGDLAAGKRPYPADGAEYLLDATGENAVWLPACWWRLVEHGAWKASDFDDDEDEEHWGMACACEVFAELQHDGWTPIRRLGTGYVERNEHFHGYKVPQPCKRPRCASRQNDLFGDADNGCSLRPPRADLLPPRPQGCRALNARPASTKRHARSGANLPKWVGARRN